MPIYAVPFGLDSERTKLLYHFRTCMGPIWKAAGDGCLQLAHEVGVTTRSSLVIDSLYTTSNLLDNTSLPGIRDP